MMEQQLNNIVKELNTIGPSPEPGIRKAAHEISRIAIESFEGHLLKSALGMVAAISQFCNDYYRLYNEPETPE